ncbi:hypothetical protein [uncultured Sphaerochaeta sp.]|uniref:hypothetical protein n=1 Tax=uncultured Sphaerochaeta sp. TaxID=886478 RepID=UPI0029CA8A1F|nr:hypothetical protein [uncultured Sphaerochaeta sp.]
MQFEPYISYEGEVWSFSYTPRTFLERVWSSSSVETSSLRLSYLNREEQHRAFYIEGGQGGLAYQLAECQTSSPSVYSWNGQPGKVYLFWDAESSHVDLSLVASWAEGEHFSLSHDISFSQGALSFDWNFGGTSERQSQTFALHMRSHGLHGSWSGEIETGPSPVFGGQKQEMEQSVHSKIRYTWKTITLESSFDRWVKTRISGEESRKTSYQVSGQWMGYAVDVTWDSTDGMSLVMKAEQGTLSICRDGIAFSLLLKKGPLSLTIKKNVKEQLSVTYSFRFTIGQDSESLLAR